MKFFILLFELLTVCHSEQVLLPVRHSEGKCIYLPTHLVTHLGAHPFVAYQLMTP